MILLSPWSRRTPDGKPGPKDYPFWPAVVTGLREKGLSVHHVACKGEPAVPGCDQRSDELPLRAIEDLIRRCTAWASVDNFFHHLAWSVGRRGVVVFGPSDPEIFGHRENVNLLKDRRFLRAKPFGLWSQETPNPEAFVAPGEVTKAVALLALGRPA